MNEYIKSKEIVNDIVNYEVENRKLQRESSITRREFWNDLYVPRELSHEVFHQFIIGNIKLLYITGHVGSGKSTLIRAMFEKHKECEGVILDMRGHIDQFQNDTPQKIRNAFYKIIRNSYLTCLRNNFKYSIYHQIPLKNLDYETIEIKPIDQNIWNGADLVREAEKKIAAQTLYYFQTYEQLFQYATKYDLSGDKDSFIKKSEQILNKKPNLIPKILKILDHKNIIFLHQYLFSEGKQHVLVIDNVDAIPLKNIQNHFLDSLIRIENNLNGVADVPLADTLNGSIKVVISIRDENISRLNKSGAAAKRDMQIKLNKNDFDIKLVDKIYTLHLEEDKVIEIINRRIEKCNKVLREDTILNNFKGLVDYYWFDNNERLSEDEGHFNIQDFSNDSIRLILDYIFNTNFYIIKSLLFRGKLRESFSKAFPYQLLIGKVIHYLWSSPICHKIIEHFATCNSDEAKNKIPMCMNGIILSYLSYLNNSIRTELLIDHIQKFFDISVLDIKEILYALENGEYKEGELITIYQNTLFSSGKGISNDGEIKLNKKGEIFLNKVIINIDYYGKLNESVHKIKNKTLMELLPDEALIYIRSIFNFLSETQKSQSVFWKDKLAPRIAEHYNTDNPFAYYKNIFTKGAEFYLNRVASSHINSIKKYIAQVSLCENGFLLIDDFSKIIKYKSVLGEDNKLFNSDEYIEEAFKDYDNNDPIKQIIAYLNKYESLKKKINEMQFLRIYDD